MEDKKLLKLLYKDPSAGMEQLMNKYTALVYAVVKGKLSESYYVSSDIEDCVADVFSEFYTELIRYDPKVSSIKSYLCILARNHAVDIVRKRARQQGDISLDDEKSLFQISDEMIFEADFSEDELRRQVFSWVKSLGEPDSSIIIRKYCSPSTAILPPSCKKYRKKHPGSPSNRGAVFVERWGMLALEGLQLLCFPQLILRNFIAKLTKLLGG